jgi:hypothetical protein
VAIVAIKGGLAFAPHAGAMGVSVEGASHFPVFVATNTSFGPPDIDPVGNYVYQLQVTDSPANGWNPNVQFVIKST